MATNVIKDEGMKGIPYSFEDEDPDFQFETTVWMVTATSLREIMLQVGNAQIYLKGEEARKMASLLTAAAEGVWDDE